MTTGFRLRENGIQAVSDIDMLLPVEQEVRAARAVVTGEITKEWV